MEVAWAGLEAVVDLGVEVGKDWESAADGEWCSGDDGRGRGEEG